MTFEKALRLTKNLLARAADKASSNAERDTCLKKANELIDSFAISQADIDADELGPLLRERLIEFGSENWKRWTHAHIGELYGVEVSWTKTVRSKFYGSLSYYGRKNQIITVKLVADYCVATIEASWPVDKVKNKLSGHSKNSYFVGAAQGIAATVKDIILSRRENAEGTGLVLVEHYKKLNLEASEYARSLNDIKSDRSLKATNQKAQSVGYQRGSTVNVSTRLKGQTRGLRSPNA